MEQQAYDEVRTTHVAVSKSVSSVTFGAGFAGSGAVNVAASTAAANMGELGQMLLSGGGGIGIMVLLGSLQGFAMKARLPVYHKYYFLNLADGFSWALMDFRQQSGLQLATTTSRRRLQHADGENNLCHPLYHCRPTHVDRSDTCSAPKIRSTLMYWLLHPNIFFIVLDFLSYLKLNHPKNYVLMFVFKVTAVHYDCNLLYFNLI